MRGAHPEYRRFNPLIVGAYFLTLALEAVAAAEAKLFQSPDCRGVFPHREWQGWQEGGSPSGFNPLIVGAYFLTFSDGKRFNVDDVAFQSPDCRGVFPH